MWSFRKSLSILVGVALLNLAGTGAKGQTSQPETALGKQPAQVPLEKSPSGGEASPDAAGKDAEKRRLSKIEIGDRLNIKIYPEDEYIRGGEMEVSGEGTITLPLLGRVTVQGLQVGEAEREIVGLLAQDYLVNPVVVIEVTKRVEEKEKRSLSILGQVQKPGSYEIPPEGKLTLLQVISLAGGFTDVANVKKIKIIRKDGDKTRVIRANAESIISGTDPDVELKQGDVVHVGESFF